MIADPATFRVLPWAPKTGWVLCDIYFGNGQPVPFSTRHLYRQTLRTLADAGYDYMAGLEVEFHIFKIDDPRLEPEAATWPPEAPKVSLHLARLCLSHRDALRPDGAGARDRAPRGAGARAAAAFGRGRARPEPVRIHVSSAGRPRARRHHDAVSQRREADVPAHGLSRDLHVPAEGAERDVERLASASIAARPALRRQRVRVGRRGTVPRPAGISSAGC